MSGKNHRGIREANRWRAASGESVGRSPIVSADCAELCDEPAPLALRLRVWSSWVAAGGPVIPSFGFSFWSRPRFTTFGQDMFGEVILSLIGIHDDQHCKK